MNNQKLWFLLLEVIADYSVIPHMRSNVAEAFEKFNTSDIPTAANLLQARDI